MKFRTFYFCCILIFAFALQFLYSEDNYLNINQTDSLFLSNNYALLASKFNIQASKALELQAELYPNPNLSMSFNSFAFDNSKFLNVNKLGQRAFSIDQLILLGGKHSSLIDIAKENSKTAQLQFEDVIRNLKYQIHISFYTLQSQNILLKNYNSQLLLLDTIITSFQVQANKGNIPMKDVVRLKSTYLKINNDNAELAQRNNEEIKKLKILLQDSRNITPLIDENVFNKYTVEPQLENLLSLALANRPDKKIVDQTITLSKLNLNFQESMAIPDVSFNLTLDHNGGYFQDQILFGLSVPIPIWNRNQGNIESAKQMQTVSEYQSKQKKVEVTAEIQEAYANMKRSIFEYNKAKKLYTNDFEIVLNGESDNFQKRNISLIEFVDFIESYNDAIAEFQRIYVQLVTSAEKINYLTAFNVY
ncbi:MAG: TolC family protein [Candidatus Kapabacteria bacterium]|nr:TolC family protein [Candidatus Kapabacteria bacterium]